MKISSFRSLLLRKISDEDLRYVIHNMDSGTLAEFVSGSLIKSARTTSNSHLMNFVTSNFDIYGHDKHSDQLHAIRDAMGHHLARYGAAVDQMHNLGEITHVPYNKGGKVDFHACKMKNGPLKDAANMHAKQFFLYMHLANKIHNHIKSGDSDPAVGKQDALRLGFVDPMGESGIRPWQGTLKREHVDLPLHLESGGKLDLPGWQSCVNPSKQPIKDYPFAEVLSSSPAHDKEHVGERASKKHLDNITRTAHSYPQDDKQTKFFNGPYPGEHVKFLNKHPEIIGQDISDPHVYKPHFFDSHPIMDSFFLPTDTEKNKEEAERYASRNADFHNNILSRPDVKDRLKQLSHEYNGKQPDYDAIHAEKFNHIRTPIPAEGKKIQLSEQPDPNTILEHDGTEVIDTPAYSKNEQEASSENVHAVRVDRIAREEGLPPGAIAELHQSVFPFSDDNEVRKRARVIKNSL